jgi:hypothetical protein
MQVEVFEDIYIDPIDIDSLSELIIFFIKGQHELVIDDIVQIDAMKNSGWYKDLKSKDKFFLDEAIEKSVRKSKNKSKIIVSNLNLEDSFSTIEANLYLKKPLQILVEHNEYDEPFYIAIIENFDYSKELLNAFQNGWLEFDHGGGSTIISVVRNNLKRKATTSPYFVKSLEKYLRCYVIMDSDREYCKIQSDGSIVQKELEDSKTKFFIDNNIPFHYLYKREKENYIPDSVFEYFMQEYAESYLKLNNHQKDFLDLEKGFSKDKKVKDRNELLQEVNELYENVGKSTFEVIGLGFSDKYPSFKAKFSLEFNNVNTEQMLSRIKHQPLIKSEIDGKERNEFEHIVNEIKRLL